MTGFFTFGQKCSKASWGKHRPKPHTCCLNTARQIALWYQFKFNLSGTVQFIKYIRVRLTWERANHFFNRTGFEQLSQTIIAITGIVAHNGQVLNAKFNQTVNEFSGLSCGTKTTNQNGCTIFNLR